MNVNKRRKTLDMTKQQRVSKSEVFFLTQMN